MSDPTAITQELVTAILTASLRDRVGRGKPFSVDELERQLGELIPERTLECYRAGEALPGLVNFLRLCAVLKGTFLNEVTQLAGLTGAHDIALGALSGAELLAHTARVSARLAEMMSDGVLDHREKRELLPLLRKLETDIGKAIAALAEQTA